ncbi:hypothetical protein GJ496_004284 [Pomphorhynchus laevis]|nr:hypothetical protein GJ496_004284 [Pomphorhynchus laevis]
MTSLNAYESMCTQYLNTIGLNADKLEYALHVNKPVSSESNRIRCVILPIYWHECLKVEGSFLNSLLNDFNEISEVFRMQMKRINQDEGDLLINIKFRNFPIIQSLSIRGIKDVSQKSRMHKISFTKGFICSISSSESYRLASYYKCGSNSCVYQHRQFVIYRHGNEPSIVNEGIFCPNCNNQCEEDIQSRIMSTYVTCLLQVESAVKNRQQISLLVRDELVKQIYMGMHGYFIVYPFLRCNCFGDKWIEFEVISVLKNSNNISEIDDLKELTEDISLNGLYVHNIFQINIDVDLIYALARRFAENTCPSNSLINVRLALLMSLVQTGIHIAIEDCYGLESILNDLFTSSLLYSSHFDLSSHSDCSVPRSVKSTLYGSPIVYESESPNYIGSLLNLSKNEIAFIFKLIHKRQISLRINKTDENAITINTQKLSFWTYIEADKIHKQKRDVKIVLEGAKKAFYPLYRTCELDAIAADNFLLEDRRYMAIFENHVPKNIVCWKQFIKQCQQRNTLYSSEAKQILRAFFIIKRQECNTQTCSFQNLIQVYHQSVGIAKLCNHGTVTSNDVLLALFQISTTLANAANDSDSPFETHFSQEEFREFVNDFDEQRRRILSDAKDCKSQLLRTNMFISLDEDIDDPFITDL